MPDSWRTCSYIDPSHSASWFTPHPLNWPTPTLFVFCDQTILHYADAGRGRGDPEPILIPKWRRETILMAWTWKLSVLQTCLSVALICIQLLPPKNSSDVHCICLELQCSHASALPSSSVRNSSPPSVFQDTLVALRPGSDSILQMILVIFSLDLSLFGSVNSVVLVHPGSTLQGWNFSFVCLFHFLMHTDALSLAEWQVSWEQRPQFFH